MGKLGTTKKKVCFNCLAPDSVGLNEYYPIPRRLGGVNCVMMCADCWDLAYSIRLPQYKLVSVKKLRNTWKSQGRINGDHAKVDEAKLVEIARLRTEGKSLAEIAEAIGISKALAYRYVKRMGL